MKYYWYSFISTLQNLNAMYDKIPEPYRFVVFIVIVIPFLGMVNMENLLLMSIGFFGMMGLCTMRVGYLSGWFKHLGKKK